MLDRILEPEVMDSAEEARDYDAMDHSAVNGIFVADFLSFWNGANPILDVGTGTAQIPVALCRRVPSARVTATDLAQHMLTLARENVRRAGLEENIRLDCRDAKNLPYPAEEFAAVISNSIVHHIPEPRQAVAEMVRVARPGAVLFVRDLLRPADEETVRHLVHDYAAEANERQKQMFADSLRAALTVNEVRTLVASLGYDASEVRQTSDRHWTWAAMRTRA
jgi:ubiquinone/menaquinone biosynthesis C-methylase UbiE